MKNCEDFLYNYILSILNKLFIFPFYIFNFLVQEILVSFINKLGLTKRKDNLQNSKSKVNTVMATAVKMQLTYTSPWHNPNIWDKSFGLFNSWNKNLRNSCATNL